MGASPSDPPAAEQVPASVPPEGVTIHGVILMPPGAETPTIVESQALMLGREHVNAPLPATAVLARVTVHGTVSNPNQPEGLNIPIQDMLAWVVSFTYPQPINVALGGQPGHPPRPIMVSHGNVIFEAHTGAFVRGFFTD